MVLHFSLDLILLKLRFRNRSEEIELTMSFKHSTPGAGKGIVKSAISATGVGKVGASRNPNREKVKAQSPEELEEEKKEKDAELRRQFDEQVAREFSTGDTSLQRLRQQQNQQNQMAQLAALGNQGAGGGFQMPQLPKLGGGQNRSNNSGGSSGTQRSNPNTHQLSKPNLIDEDKKQQGQKINPLQQPGQSNNSDRPEAQTQRPSISPRSDAPEDKINLPEAVAEDVQRLGSARDPKAPPAQDVRQSYVDNADKHSLRPSDVRRLAAHGIPFRESFFDPSNDLQKNDAVVNRLISTRNESSLSKLSNNTEIASHYKSMGFSRGDYSQLTARQFKDSFEYIEKVRNNPDARSDKQALVLLPEKGATEFDMSREVEDLKKLGFEPVFAQYDSENGFKLHNADGSQSPVKRIAEDLGGFDLLVMGGHGQNTKTPAIRFGLHASENPDKANVEKAYLDESDLAYGSAVREFFEDKGILKEGGTIASCSCSFTGSKASRGEDHIKPEESMAALIQDIRPDADVMGAFDEVFASNSKYTLDSDGNLQNPTMRRLEDNPIQQEDLDQVAQVDFEETLEATETFLDNLDNFFDEDDDT